jgi:hypothetical protein
VRPLILTLILLTTFLSFCSKKNSTNSDPVSTEDLLTKDGEISGWLRTGDFWTANSSSELSNRINGEEPLYTRHGFIEASMQQYSGTILNTTVSVEIRIFNQGNSINVGALFEEYILQMINPINWSAGAGEDAKIERLQLAQRIVFRKDRYFISLNISSGLDEALDVLKTFANNINSRIK